MIHYAFFIAQPKYIYHTVIKINQEKRKSSSKDLLTKVHICSDYTGFRLTLVSLIADK